MFFARFIGRGNNEIHTKSNSVSDESGKEEGSLEKSEYQRYAAIKA